jgi:hypothetical protein
MLRDCFADEIAIDFPSLEPAVERMRDAFLGERTAEAIDGIVRRDVQLSRREAWDGLVVPVDVPIRTLCRHCGGRGETWTDRCEACGGAGATLSTHVVRVTLPRGVSDGSRVRFRVSSPGVDSVRVELRVAILNRVIE